jgi:hypothetical protein
MITKIKVKTCVSKEKNKEPSLPKKKPKKLVKKKDNKGNAKIKIYIKKKKGRKFNKTNNYK